MSETIRPRFIKNYSPQDGQNCDHEFFEMGTLLENLSARGGIAFNGMPVTSLRWWMPTKCMIATPNLKVPLLSADFLCQGCALIVPNVKFIYAQIARGDDEMMIPIGKLLKRLRVLAKLRQSDPQGSGAESHGDEYEMIEVTAIGDHKAQFIRGMKK